VDFKFWEYQYEVILDAPDSELAKLDRVAANLSASGWGMEFDGDVMRYRFETKRDAVVFAIFCRIKVLLAPSLS
jgi:hypothetical protein